MGGQKDARPDQHRQYTIFIVIVKYKMVSRLFSGGWGTAKARAVILGRMTLQNPDKIAQIWQYL